MITSALNSALQGLQSNQKSFLDSTRRLSQFGNQEGPEGAAGESPATDVVGLMTAHRGYDANLLVVRTADEMLGSLLDVLA